MQKVWACRGHRLVPTSQADYGSVLPGGEERKEKDKGTSHAATAQEQENTYGWEGSSFAGRALLFCFGWELYITSFYNVENTIHNGNGIETLGGVPRLPL